MVQYGRSPHPGGVRPPRPGTDASTGAGKTAVGVLGVAGSWVPPRCLGRSGCREPCEEPLVQRGSDLRAVYHRMAGVPLGWLLLPRPDEAALGPRTPPPPGVLPPHPC